MTTAIGSGPSLGERYRLVRTLRTGHGVRTVLAVDARSDDQVVLKIIERRLVPEDACTRLEHEAALLRGIKTPCVTPLLEVTHDADRLCLVMPYVAGTTLQERLSTGPLSVGETLLVLRSLLGALAELHDHGVFHGDIKPANVVLGAAPSDRVTLIDFGNAHRVSLAGSLREEQIRAARYMSPEQAGLVGGDVDKRTDLYSLGIVAFECLAGRPPFGAGDVGQLLRQHLSTPPPMLRGVGFVPRSLDDVVQRMLQKDPDDRYQSARAVLADLEAFAGAVERGVSDPQLVVGALDRRRTLTEPNLTGRESELALLAQNLVATKFGQGRLVMVEAESGGGKTRLLDEFCRQAASEAVWILRGQGVDRAAARPLQVLDGVAAEVLSATRGSPALAADLRERLGHHRLPLSRVLPELSEVLDAQDQSPDDLDAYGRAHGVESLVALLDALGTPERPALVVLDDCQWIDEMSVRVLHSWVNRETAPDRPGPNVLIVVAVRHEGALDDHPLRGLSNAARVELPPLSRDQVRRVVESMAGAIPSQALDVVVRLSGGSPFMAIAVLRGLVESGALSAGDEGWHFEPFPQGVRASSQAAAVLARRLELLDPVARRLLSSGAVLGREFDLRLASVLAGQRDTESEEAVAQAVQRNLVWKGPDQQFTFVHDRVRETFLETLDTEDLTRLHRRAAEEIVLVNPSRVFEISYHFDAGGQPARALPYAISAAESARSRDDLELAERQFRIAERGAARADHPTQQRVAAGLGEVLMLRGRYAEAGQRLRRALDLARDKLSSARIQGQLGELAFKHDDLEGAVASIEEALRMLDETVPRQPVSLTLGIGRELAARLTTKIRPARRRHGPMHAPGDERRLLAAHLYARLLYAWYFSKRGTLATVWVLLRQVNTAERCPSSRQLARAYGLYAAGMASTFPPLWKRALRYVERARAVHQQVGDPVGERHALSRALVLCAAGRFSEGEKAALQAMRFLQRTGDLWELYWAAFHRSLCLYRMGDLAGAIDQARSTHDAATALGDRQAAATTLEIWAKASGGHLPAEPIAVALSDSGVDVQTASALLQAQALLLRAQDRHGDAIRYAEEAVALPRRLRVMNMYLVTALPLLTTLYREMAEEAALPGARRRCLRRAARTARRTRRYAALYRNELPHALRECAMIAALQGRYRRARRLFRKSLHEARRRDAQAEMAETLRLRVRVGRLLGWPEPSGDPDRSGPVFESIGPGGSQAPSGATIGLAERFDTLLAAGGPLVSAGSSEEIAGAIKEAVMVLLRPDHCRVVGIGLGQDVELDDGRSTASLAETSLVQRAMGERQPVVLTAPSDDARLRDTLVKAGFRSALCAPVIVADEVVGYLLASHSRVAGLFGDEERRLAQFIAHLAGAALERERLQRAMRAEVIVAQEAERARVARDLHDEIGQALTSVLLGVRLVHTSLSVEPLDRDQLLQRTEAVRQVASDALGQVQRLAFELRPTILDDLGLVAALRRLVGEIASRYHITVELSVSRLAPGDRVPPDVETTAYRVAQEALTNVVRHAQAATCGVVLARVEDRLRLVVEDKGVGYEVTPASERSLGIRGMAERAALLGGTVKIRSSPGEGTVVALEVPVG